MSDIKTPDIIPGPAPGPGGLEGPIVCPSGGEAQPLVITTRVDDVLNWFRESSIWYLLFATACCGIELMQTGGPRTDLDRFGAVFRASPRQSDLLIVAGSITYKMADRVRLIYSQMSEPKYVLAMGSCANCGGLFKNSYSVVQGVDAVVPVDIYLPGCPPRPEALNEAILRLQDKMRSEHWADRRKTESGSMAASADRTVAAGPGGSIASAAGAEESGPQAAPPDALGQEPEKG